MPAWRSLRLGGPRLQDGLCISARDIAAGRGRALFRASANILSLFWSVSSRFLVTSQSVSVLAAPIQPYFRLIGGHATCSLAIAQKKVPREVREEGFKNPGRRPQPIASIVSRCGRSCADGLFITRIGSDTAATSREYLCDELYIRSGVRFRVPFRVSFQLMRADATRGVRGRARRSAWRARRCC